jgi:DNA-binding transcriptional MerR regulator
MTEENEIRIYPVYIDGPLKGKEHAIRDPRISLVLPLPTNTVNGDTASDDPLSIDTERVVYHFYPCRLFRRVIILGSLHSSDAELDLDNVFDQVISAYAKRSVILYPLMRDGMPRIEDIIGATYRQLDHWCRTGYLKPVGGTNGVQRRFPPEELKVAKTMARLVDLGFNPGAAASYARRMVRDGDVGKVEFTEEGRLKLAGIFSERYKERAQSRIASLTDR